MVKDLHALLGAKAVERAERLVHEEQEQAGFAGFMTQLRGMLAEADVDEDGCVSMAELRALFRQNAKPLTPFVPWPEGTCGGSGVAGGGGAGFASRRMAAGRSLTAQLSHPRFFSPARTAIATDLRSWLHVRLSDAVAASHLAAERSATASSSHDLRPSQAQTHCAFSAPVALRTPRRRRRRRKQRWSGGVLAVAGGLELRRLLFLRRARRFLSM